MAQKPCVTGLAYEMRRALQGIYGRKDAEEARKLFGNWCAWVQAMRERPGELLEPAAREAASPWMPFGGVHDHHALLGHRKERPTVPLTH